MSKARHRYPTGERLPRSSDHLYPKENRSPQAVLRSHSDQLLAGTYSRPQLGSFHDFARRKQGNCNFPELLTYQDIPTLQHGVCNG